MADGKEQDSGYDIWDVVLPVAATYLGGRYGARAGKALAKKLPGYRRLAARTRGAEKAYNEAQQGYRAGRARDEESIRTRGSDELGARRRMSGDDPPDPRGGDPGDMWQGQNSMADREWVGGIGGRVAGAGTGAAVGYSAAASRDRNKNRKKR